MPERNLTNDAKFPQNMTREIIFVVPAKNVCADAPMQYTCADIQAHPTFSKALKKTLRAFGMVQRRLK